MVEGLVVLLFTSLLVLRRSKRRFYLEHVNFELLFVEIVINSLTFVCGVCYRPPNYNAEDNNAFLDNWQSSLDNIQGE